MSSDTSPGADLINGNVSFWFEAIGGRPAPRPALPGDATADVCIVGAGFTGLWTAYYLKKADPSLDIVVLEREFAGYGASGRNGGWASGLIAGSRDRFADLYGVEAVKAQQRLMHEAVDEIVVVGEAEGIKADVVKGGTIRIASTRSQVRRLAAGVAEDHRWGVTESRVLDDRELRERIRIPEAVKAAYTPHCARMQPAQYVRGLADVVESLGVTIREATTVTRVESGKAHTGRGVVRAPVILRATEGYTASLAGERRTWLPMNSSMIVTEPLPRSVWDEIGWSRGETLGDKCYSHMYGQRTADGRIAIGGRGIPYRFGSATDRDGATQEATIRSLTEILHRRFPAARGYRVEHAWCGVLGVPRDWCSSAVFDPATGLGHAGGYVGQGLTTTNLAGRTLRDLVLGHDTELTRLPWVGHTSRKWEVEPLRWLGVRSMYLAYSRADRRELAGRQRESRLARLADVISRRP
ncbi:FAD-dependent oxidoreductase [Streptomyces sp. NPDC006385]|uniref:NAD(P)/FAD-dependent oxidoreductase n=1 Tax=Streptomyces sp. NPDC006385 TaxID=3156761 RepID=UPI0033BEC912